jgi:hypothetical protein
MFYKMHPYTAQDTFGCSVCGAKPEVHDHMQPYIVRDNRRLFTEEWLEGYSIGYYYGRTIGSDEPGRTEIEKRFGKELQVIAMITAGFKEGYDRGVADYVDFDSEEG